LNEACWAADDAFLQALLKHGADAKTDIDTPLSLVLISNTSPHPLAVLTKKGGRNEAWDPSLYDTLLAAGARISFPQQQRPATMSARKPTALSSILSYARTHLPAKVATFLAARPIRVSQMQTLRLSARLHIAAAPYHDLLHALGVGRG
jgi:hypothetical protein